MHEQFSRHAMVDLSSSAVLPHGDRAEDYRRARLDSLCTGSYLSLFEADFVAIRFSNGHSAVVVFTDRSAAESRDTIAAMRALAADRLATS